MNNTFLSRLDWRFATKKFDATKKLTSETLAEILRAIRFAPTSYGVQPFHVFVVTDPTLRTQLRAVSYDQAQVTDASVLLVYCARTDLAERVDRLFDLMSRGDPAVLEQFAGYKGVVDGAMSGHIASGNAFAWASKQAYIGLGFGLAAAAELGVDACPMEGFQGGEVDKVLGLPPHMKSVAYTALGYRSADPERAKVRFPESDMFTMR